MEYEYKLTLSVKGKNSRTGSNSVTPKQRMKKELESFFGKNNEAIDINSGEGNSLNIYYTPSILTSDVHNDFSGSREDMLEHLKNIISIKYIVDYDDINPDSFEMVSADRIGKIEEIQVLEDTVKNLEASLTASKRGKNRSDSHNSTYDKLHERNKTVESTNKTLKSTNKTLKSTNKTLESKNETLENRIIELDSESIELEPDSKLYSNDPVELLNFINEETKKKFVEDHSDYSKHAEELGTDGVLEYIVKLVESSNYLDTNEVKFTAGIIENADNGQIFDDIEVLEDIVMYYAMEKRDNNLDRIPESIQKIEATLAKDTKDDPQDVTEARAFVGMYELWDEGSILKEQSMPAYDSSLRIIKNHDSKKSRGDKELAMKKGTVKLMEHFAKELDKSKIKWSDIESLMEERDERSKNGVEFMYFGLRTEGGLGQNTNRIPVEPIPFEVAVNMGYFVESLSSKKGSA